MSIVDHCIQCGRELQDPPMKYGFKRLPDNRKICEICWMTSWVSGYTFDDEGNRIEVKEPSLWDRILTFFNGGEWK